MKLNLTTNTSPDLLRDPVRPMEAATKSYVDTVNTQHASNNFLHLSSQQHELLAALSVSSTELNYLTGATSAIQAQLDNKLNLSGGALSGSLTLSGLPTAVNHASTKGYVDTQVASSVSKAGGVMTGGLTLSANPTSNLHASTKEYVDTSVSSHAGLFNLHLTSDQNVFMDALTVSAFEVNYLQGATENIQLALNAKLSNAGGTLTGNLSLDTGVSVFTAKLPTVDNELVNKAYVDAKVRGLEWKDPISASNLVSDALSAPPSSPVVGDVYIVAASPTGVWSGKAGFATFYDGATWVYLRNTAVEPGDRFGVRFTSTSTASTSLTTKLGKIVTVVSGTPGAYVWVADEITAGSSTLVFDRQAPDFGVTYCYTDEGVWTITNTSVNITSGDGLLLTGNTLSVSTADGVRTFNNKVSLDIDASTGLGLNGARQLTLNLDPSDFAVTSGAVGLTAANKTILSNAISKSATTNVTGTVNFVSGGKLVITTAPTGNSDVTNKVYVDTLTTGLQTSVNSINTTLGFLTADPTTQTFVISGLNTKFDKAGGTISGDVVIASTKGITLSKAPVATGDVTNKYYVDSTLLVHTSDATIHVTSIQRTLLDGITASAAELNHTVGVTSPIQNQINLKLNLSGGTMTGGLTLFGAPSAALHATTKSYVDTGLDLKLDKTGGTVTGQIKNATNPVVADDLARRGYVDGVDTAARLYTTDQFNLAFLKSGGTLTGFVSLNADPTDALHATTKQYVDAADIYISNITQGSINTLTTDLNNTKTRITSLETDVVKKAYVDTQDATKIDKTGGALTGYLILHADPTLDTHPATKRYVDTFAQGLKTKPAIRLATTTNLSATYSNGTLGVNATLTGTSNGALSVDGVAVGLNNRILVRAQSVALQNGDYFVQQTGSAGTPFILKRNINADEKDEIPGSYFFVFDGATLKSTSWTLSVADPTNFNLGTDSITVNQFSGAGTTVAGNGLTLSGNTLSVVTAASSRLTVTAGGVDLATSGITPGTYKSLVIDSYGRASAGANPTTLAGYGVTDAQGLNANLTSLSGVSTSALLVRDLSGTIKTQSLLVAGTGLSVSQDGSSNSVSNITITSNATTAATPSTLVARDSSGNFSAVQVTAALVGNASTATTLLASVNVQLSGDMTSNIVSFNGSTGVNLAAILAATGVTAGTYSRVTVDAKGRVTSATNPTTLTGYGITDAATLAYVDAKVAELEAKLSDLRAYVMTRV